MVSKKKQRALKIQEKIKHLSSLVLDLHDDFKYIHGNVEIIKAFLPMSKHGIHEFIVSESFDDLDDILEKYKKDLDAVLAEIKSFDNSQ